MIPKIRLVELLLIIRAELQNENSWKSSLWLEEQIRKLSFDKNNTRNKFRLDPGKFIKDNKKVFQKKEENDGIEKSTIFKGIIRIKIFPKQRKIEFLKRTYQVLGKSVEKHHMPKHILIYLIFVFLTQE